MDNEKKLSEATIQDLQMELIRRTFHNEMEGDRIAADLMANRQLWISALVDRVLLYHYDEENERQIIRGLYKLRDLSRNEWNVDNLFILAVDEQSALQIKDIAEKNQWGGEFILYDAELTAMMIGEPPPHRLPSDRRLISIWWD